MTYRQNRDTNSRLTSLETKARGHEQEASISYFDTQDIGECESKARQDTQTMRPRLGRTFQKSNLRWPQGKTIVARTALLSFILH